MARDTFAVGTRVRIKGPSIFDDDTRRGEVTEVENPAYPTHLDRPAVLVKRRDGSNGRLYPASSLEVVPQFKVGDAVRVKAGSPTYGDELNGMCAPSRDSFGKKLIIYSDESKKHAMASHHSSGYFYTRLPDGSLDCGATGCYLEPWNDAEEWRDGKWVARKPATPKQFAKGVAVRLLPGFESVLCGGYDANALRGKILITIHESLNYGVIALSETVGGGRVATLQNSEFLEAWVDPPVEHVSHIVMLREDGRLKPNSPPVEHVSQGEAEREAERLAAKAPGSAFEVWGRVATRHVEPPKPPVASPEPKYRVGEQVRVVGDPLGHGFRIGDVVTVVLVESDGGVKASGWVPGRGILSQWVSDSTMGPSVEPLDAPKPAPRAFRDGDTIRVIRDTTCMVNRTPVARGTILRVDDRAPMSGDLINARRVTDNHIATLRKSDTEVV